MQALQDIFFLIDKPFTLLDYKIDNYSCCVNTCKFIDIESFFRRELSVNCTYTEENFSCVTIYCPKDLILSPKQCCHVYRTGYFVLVGARQLSHSQDFFLWIIEKINPYMK